MGRKVTTRTEGKGQQVIVVDMDARRCETCLIVFDWLKILRINRMQRFTFFLCVFALTYGLTYSYLITQVTTIEKQFGFSSTHMGWILSSYDFGFIITVLFVGHYAHRLHRPRIIGVSAFVIGASTVLVSLPYFLFLLPEGGAARNQYGAVNETRGNLEQSHIPLSLCSGSSTARNTTCWTPSHTLLSENTLSFVIFLIVFTLAGASPTALWTLGLSYIDDNGDKNKAPVYIGVVLSVKMAAPVVGFILGSVTSSLHLNLSGNPTVTSNNPKDPSWVGAWWLGFVISGGLSLLVAIPLLFFPKEMSVDESSREQIARQMKRSQKTSIKSLPPAVLRLVKHPVFMPLALAMMFQVASGHGYSVYLPKYLQSQFHLTAYVSNALVAVVFSLSSAVGSALSGYIVSKLRMSINDLCIRSLIVITAMVVFFPTLLAFRCATPPIYGIGLQSNNGIIETKCSKGCPCWDMDYHPVCGSDGRTYSSPCSAGCTDYEIKTGKLRFTNCSCVTPNPRNAMAGICDTGCLMFLAYAGVLFVPVFVTSLVHIPWIMLSMRCLPEDDKSLGLGFITFIISLAAFPLPIIYGFFIDQTCVIPAPPDPCHPDKTNCLLYDMDSFRLRFHLVTLGLSCLQPVLLFISWFNARKTVYPSQMKPEDKAAMARIVRRSSDTPKYKESYGVTAL